MWNFDSIEIENLFTHTNTRYAFKANELVQVKGENRDEFKSNGAGKSTILEAINLAIVGETYRKTGKDDFIRNDEKECRVALKLHNDFLKKKVEIERKFYRSSSARVKLVVNGKDESGQITNNKNDPNKIILSLLGIEREDLLNYFLLGQGNNKSFLTCSDTKQKEIIARFSNFALLDSIEEELKQQLKEENRKSEKVTSELALIEDKISYAEELRKSEKIEFENRKKERIDFLKSNIDSLQNEVEEIRDDDLNLKEYKRLSGEIKALDKEGSNINAIDLSNKLEESENLLEECEGNISRIRKEIGSLEVKLGGKVSCPKCGNEFIPDAESSLDDVTKRLKNKKKKLVEQKEIQSFLQKGIEEFKTSISEYKTNLNKKSSYKSQLIRIKERMEKEADKVEKLNEKIRRFKAELKEEDKSTFKPKETKFSVSALKKEQEELKLKCREIESKIEELDFQLYHIGKKGFKTYLANLAIKSIEDMTNSYLKKFTELRLKISGYKLLKSGEVREKIDVSISRDGITNENFYKFSGGEESVINICCLLALHKLINNSLESGGINFLALDEYIISMDEENESKAIDLLATTGVTTMLIMQHTVSYVKNILTVVKKNKISKILA